MLCHPTHVSLHLAANLPIGLTRFQLDYDEVVGAIYGKEVDPPSRTGVELPTRDAWCLVDPQTFLELIEICNEEILKIALKVKRCVDRVLDSPVRGKRFLVEFTDPETKFPKIVIGRFSPGEVPYIADNHPQDFLWRILVAIMFDRVSSPSSERSAPVAVKPLHRFQHIPVREVFALERYFWHYKPPSDAARQQ